jgi:RNA 2',3'-cyclic 3'-phosphodiesterase
MAATATTSEPARQPARLRLFVAIALPDAWRCYLAERQAALERLAPGYARWVTPELLHLTLVFLGELPVNTLPAIQEAVAAAAADQSPFPLSLGRLGHFGGAAPRVLWVEARAPGQQLDALHCALAAALAARDVPFDRKPLVPHLTLGRARRNARRGPGPRQPSLYATHTHAAPAVHRGGHPPHPQRAIVARAMLYRVRRLSTGERRAALALPMIIRRARR